MRGPVILGDDMFHVLAKSNGFITVTTGVAATRAPRTTARVVAVARRTGSYVVWLSRTVAMKSLKKKKENKTNSINDYTFQNLQQTKKTICLPERGGHPAG